jgi:hypothetical protein
VNGEVCNTVRAIWTEDKAALKEEDYRDFYRFVANAYDDPVYRCAFLVCFWGFVCGCLVPVGVLVCFWGFWLLPFVLGSGLGCFGVFCGSGGLGVGFVLCLRRPGLPVRFCFVLRCSYWRDGVDG